MARYPEDLRIPKDQAGVVDPLDFIVAADGAKYGPVLLKACVDPFMYAVKLTTGEIIEFERCEIVGDWIHLSGIERGMDGFMPERGVAIHIDQIVWALDAPHGS